jgi:hypothetical protein
MNALFETINGSWNLLATGVLAGAVCYALASFIKTLLTVRKLKHEKELLRRISGQLHELQLQGAKPEELQLLIQNLKLDVSSKDQKVI